jgi:hypothetical protein
MRYGNLVPSRPDDLCALSCGLVVQRQCRFEVGTFHSGHLPQAMETADRRSLAGVADTQCQGERAVDWRIGSGAMVPQSF